MFDKPIFVFLKKIMYHPTQKEKILNEAIKKGHVVKAKLIKVHDVYDYNEFGTYSTGEKMGTYEYSYNGKTYKRKFLSFNKFGDKVDLYFISNPRKTEFGDNLWITAKNHWIRSFFLITLLGTIVLWIIINFKWLQWSDVENIIYKLK